MIVRLRTRAIFLFVWVLLMITGPWSRAEEARTKGPDVVTAGTGPYTGPTAAELAKLAGQETGSGADASVGKAQEAATINREGGNTLTPAELLKLQTLLQTLPPPDMLKLPVMELSKDGTPEMTAQELQKLARMRVQEGTVGTTGGGGTISGSGQTETQAPVREAGGGPAGRSIPKTPDKASRTGR